MARCTQAISSRPIPSAVPSRDSFRFEVLFLARPEGDEFKWLMFEFSFAGAAQRTPAGFFMPTAGCLMVAGLSTGLSRRLI